LNTKQKLKSKNNQNFELMAEINKQNINLFFDVFVEVFK